MDVDGKELDFVAASFSKTPYTALEKRRKLLLVFSCSGGFFFGLTTCNFIGRTFVFSKSVSTWYVCELSVFQKKALAVVSI